MLRFHRTNSILPSQSSFHVHIFSTRRQPVPFLTQDNGLAVFPFSLPENQLSIAFHLPDGTRCVSVHFALPIFGRFVASLAQSQYQNLDYFSAFSAESPSVRLSLYTVAPRRTSAISHGD
jgi:hypothetical protein